MITIYIKRQQFFKNVDEFGNIFKIQYPTRKIVSENGEIITETYDNYIENGFTKVELEDEYKDCIYDDFNEDFSFNPVKYQTRKTTEITKQKIVEYKQKLIDTDYKAIKYAEGVMSLDEYAPVKIEREMYRSKINELEKSIM